MTAKVMIPKSVASHPFVLMVNAVASINATEVQEKNSDRDLLTMNRLLKHIFLYI